MRKCWHHRKSQLAVLGYTLRTSVLLDYRKKKEMSATGKEILDALDMTMKKMKAQVSVTAAELRSIWQELVDHMKTFP